MWQNLYICSRPEGEVPAPAGSPSPAPSYLSTGSGEQVSGIVMGASEQQAPGFVPGTSEDQKLMPPPPPPCKPHSFLFF